MTCSTQVSLVKFVSTWKEFASVLRTSSTFVSRYLERGGVQGALHSADVKSMLKKRALVSLLVRASGANPTSNLLKSITEINLRTNTEIKLLEYWLTWEFL